MASGGEIFDAECIKKRRIRKGVEEFLVKWKGYSDKDNTWEPRQNIIDDRLFINFEKEQSPSGSGYSSGKGADSADKKKVAKQQKRAQSKSLDGTPAGKRPKSSKSASSSGALVATATGSKSGMASGASLEQRRALSRPLTFSTSAQSSSAALSSITADGRVHLAAGVDSDSNSSSTSSSSDSFSDSSYEPDESAKNDVAVQPESKANSYASSRSSRASNTGSLPPPSHDADLLEPLKLKQTGYEPSADISMEPEDFFDNRVVGDVADLQDNPVLALSPTFGHTVSNPPFDMADPASPFLDLTMSERGSPQPASSASSTVDQSTSARAASSSVPSKTLTPEKKDASTASKKSVTPTAKPQSNSPASKLTSKATSSPKSVSALTAAYASQQNRLPGQSADAASTSTRPPKTSAVASSASKLSPRSALKSTTNSHSDHRVGTSNHRHQILDSSGHILEEIDAADPRPPVSGTLATLIAAPVDNKKGGMNRTGWVPPGWVPPADEASPVQITYVTHNGLRVVFKESNTGHNFFNGQR
ncbi:chromobox protein homolog 2-like isoform X1 [Sycon ciliatum]|uniref:chromobox protein homolog 2-like isoform X1 n=1 Tax=Sycon ciliatum TaxID=27933 RepID=UPI0031F61998